MEARDNLIMLKQPLAQIRCWAQLSEDYKLISNIQFDGIDHKDAPD
jgi:hypothetical protein